MANYGLVRTIIGSVKWLKSSRKPSQKEIQRALFSNKAIYTISPSLFQRPRYWPPNLQVLGYHERKKTNNWKPEKKLQEFLEKHPKKILVTFGSMINQNPPAKTVVILQCLEELGIPAIINTASGGLVKPVSYNEDLFVFVNRIPYDWICPQLYAVIHHGGSGTTHTALKYGCATLIIPHIIDQYVWNKIIHQKGAGPLGTDVSKISINNLKPKIKDLWVNPVYKENVLVLSQQMQDENYREALYQQIVE